MVKLYIELVMTDLIIKVTRKSQALDYSAQRSPKPRFASKGCNSLRAWPGKRNFDEESHYTAHVFGKRDSYQVREEVGEVLRISEPGEGVKKTVVMEVESKMGMEVDSGVEQEFEMSTSSMEELNIEVARYSGPGGKFY
jgi:hypothetical protein